jgi:hypothetical protein
MGGYRLEELNQRPDPGKKTGPYLKNNYSKKSWGQDLSARAT